MKTFLGVLYWLLLIPANFLSVAIAYLFGPVIVLFCNKDGWLPKWLSWFQTPDNPMDGDEGWVKEHWQWRYKLPKWLGTYLGRVGWCWRNPAYGFGEHVLSAKNPPEPFVWRGTRDISDQPIVRDGWLFVTAGYYWNVYVICPSLFGKTLRIYLGWKLREGEGKSPYQYVCYTNPFKNRPKK